MFIIEAMLLLIGGWHAHARVGMFVTDAMLFLIGGWHAHARVGMFVTDAMRFLIVANVSANVDEHTFLTIAYKFATSPRIERGPAY